MARLRHNLAASFLGRGWSALIQLLLVPVFLKLLGAEQYALIGFYALLYSVVIRLDLGLSTTLNRELARTHATLEEVTDGPRLMRDLLRSLEGVYFAVAMVVGVAIAAVAPVLGRHWLHAESLPSSTVQLALALMGLVVAVQWPISLYEGGLRGLERQGVLNAIGAGVATLRGVGAVLLLLYVSRTVIAYFLWQAVVNLVQVALLAAATWRAMPAGERPRFRRAELHRVAAFTAGISGISLLSLALTQADKIVLSRLLPLDRFGYYNVAATVAAGLVVISMPLFEAVFPRFSNLAARGDDAGLRATYHAAMQLSGVLAIPVVAVLVAFSREIAMLWLHDAVAVERVHLLMAMLAAGTAANVIMTVPFALQLAVGWTSLSLWKNVIALALAIPMLLVGVHLWAEVGAAAVWIAINVGYLVFELPYMHRRVLPGVLAQVYLRDLGGPAIAATVAVVLIRLVADGLSVPPALLVITVSGIALGASAAASPIARRLVRGWLATTPTAAGPA